MQSDNTSPWHNATGFIQTICDLYPNLTTDTAQHGVYIQEAIDQLQERIGSVLPDEIVRFYRWYTPARWLDIVNPARLRESDRDQKIITLQGDVITPGHPRDAVENPLRIYAIDDDDVGVSTPETYDSSFMDNVVWLIERGTLGREWLTTPMFRFGSSDYGEDLLYLLDPPADATGRVCMLKLDDNPLLYLGETLTAWVAKLICCSGFEMAYSPGNLEELPEPHRSWCTDEFKRLNPRSTWL